MSVASSSSPPRPPCYPYRVQVYPIRKIYQIVLVVALLLLNCNSQSTVFAVGPNHDYPRPVAPAGLQPRSSTPRVPCPTSTATIHALCSVPDLNDDHPRPVFPAGPQQRPSTPSVPCRTSTATIHAQCPCGTSTTTIHDQ